MQLSSRVVIRMVPVVALLTLAGCTVINKFEEPPVVGAWAGRSDTRNSMSLEVDGRGRARVFSAVAGIGEVQDRFRITWLHAGEDDFDLELRCNESSFSCNDNDPSFECEINARRTRLVCVTDHPRWVDYPFSWDKEDD